jgi:hypothetical protein
MKHIIIKETIKEKKKKIKRIIIKMKPTIVSMKPLAFQTCNPKIER